MCFVEVRLDLGQESLGGPVLGLYGASGSRGRVRPLRTQTRLENVVGMPAVRITSLLEPIIVKEVPPSWPQEHSSDQCPICSKTSRTANGMSEATESRESPLATPSNCGWSRFSVPSVF